MIELELDRKGVAVAEAAMKALSDDKIAKIVQRSSRRAAITARKVGTQAIREIYAVKGAEVVKSGVSFRSLTDGTEIRVKGNYPLAEKMYKTKVKKSGIFVSIKKGTEAKVERGFVNPKAERGFVNPKSRLFVQRQGRDRMPLKGVYGPALPQLFGNARVQDAMQEEGMDMYEKRLWHELDRALGGK